MIFPFQLATLIFRGVQCTSCPMSNVFMPSPLFLDSLARPAVLLSLTSIANVLEVARLLQWLTPMDESRHTSASMALFFFWKHVHESSSILRLDMIQGKKNPAKINHCTCFLNIIQLQQKVWTWDFWIYQTTVWKGQVAGGAPAFSKAWNSCGPDLCLSANRTSLMVAISGSLTVIASPREKLRRKYDTAGRNLGLHHLILTELARNYKKALLGNSIRPGHITLQQQAGRPGVPATSEKQTICGPKDGFHIEFNANFFNGICIQNCWKFIEIYRNAKTSWWLNQPIWKYSSLSQIGSFLSGIGVKIKHIWVCHHLEEIYLIAHEFTNTLIQHDTTL